MVPDLAVSAATEIVGGFWKPRSAIYAALRLRSTVAGRQGPAIALAGSAEIVQNVVACGSREEGRFGMAVASIAVGTAQPIRALLFTYRPTPGAVRGADGGGSGLHTLIVEISAKEGL
jgi:hypothetical protein